MLTQAELEQCPRYVEQTGDGVIGATRGMSDAQWNFKQSPERWSIAEIVEHMVCVQELVLGPILAGLAQAPVAPARDYAVVDAIVIEQFPLRGQKFNAPEPTRPSGRMAPGAALEKLMANGGRLKEYVEKGRDLRLRTVEAPPLKAITGGRFEQMDGYQWVLAVAAHTERHIKQIREVQGDARYPD